MDLDDDELLLDDDEDDDELEDDDDELLQIKDENEIFAAKISYKTVHFNNKY